MLSFVLLLFSILQYSWHLTSIQEHHKQHLRWIFGSGVSKTTPATTFKYVVDVCLLSIGVTIFFPGNVSQMFLGLNDG